MGNAGVGLSGGLDAAYYNPAAFAAIEGHEASFTHALWLADISYDYAAAALPLGKWGNAYGSVTALNSGEMDVRTVAQPLGTGERFTVSDVALGLGYAKQITDRFAMGLVVSWIQETVWHSSLNTVTIGFGTLYAVTDNGLHIGASLSNYGTQGGFSGRDLRMTFDADPSSHGDNSQLPAEQFTNQFPVPVLFRVGLGLPVRINQATRLQLAVDAFHPSDNTESVSLGAELAYRKLIALRCGYQNLWEQDSEVGLTAGAGIRGTIDVYTYRLDYGWADQGRLGATHRFTVGMTF
jgi:hypothetical protein